MQRRITLLRHGHAEEHPNDFARPLSPIGRDGALAAGQALARAGWVPAYVLTSDAPRALATADLTARAAGFAGDIAQDHRLYLAPDTLCISALQALPDQAQSVWLVGHNPGLSRLATDLLGRPCELAPAEYANIELELPRWSDL